MQNALEYIENNPCRKLDNLKEEKNQNLEIPWTVEELDKVLKLLIRQFMKRQFYTTISGSIFHDGDASL